MPVSPRHACPVYPCPNLVPPGQVFCEDHYRPRQKSTYEKDRPSAAKRGYDREWYKMRSRFLRNNPNCIECGGKANQVDHIIPRSQGGPDEESNFQPLCQSCHSRKTVKHDGGFGNKRQPRV